IPTVREAIFRDLWFDEALTVREFMFLPNIKAVYFSYVIPNNHIIYTILLKLWNELYLSLPFISSRCAPDLYWRLFTVLTSVLLLAVIFIRWRQRYGLIPVTLVLFAFCFSLPFGIYATAIRGYMLSMLWIAASFEFARAWTQSPNWRTGFAYFICCLLAVGTIPSNLPALAGIVIILFPDFGFKRIFTRKFLFLALTPLAATALFYLPLYRCVAGILSLREGWRQPGADVLEVYSAFLTAFLPLIIAGVIGGFIYLRRPGKRKYLWGLTIFLLPLLIILLRRPAPFPRVFLCLWPLWMLLLTVGLTHLTAVLRKRNRRLLLTLILLITTFGWAKFCTAQRESLARTFHTQGNLDDFFYPYYMAPEHKPWQMVREIGKLSKENAVSVYISFTAEPGVILLYGQLAGLDPQLWRYDLPRPSGKLKSLPRPVRLLLKQGELPSGALEELRRRFGLESVKPLFSDKTYVLFEVP
ncbi:MAG: hypothetical protein PHV59_08695, partial [Victivallales bacterium]|nr:hypothetical protein [Victivallales bacterium]